MIRNLVRQQPKILFQGHTSGTRLLFSYVRISFEDGLTYKSRFLMPSKQGFVYILSNKTRTVLYTGVTSSLIFRVQKHRQGKGCYFTRKYNARYLLYYERYQSIQRAIEREKQIKNWKREWKLDLIKEVNPKLRDIWEETIKEFDRNSR